MVLGDARLHRRLVKVAAQLSRQPLSSINQACADWSDTKAAYRFFANEKVSAEQVLAPHTARTRARMRAHQRVLVAQDTTEVDYSTHPKTTGLGPIGNHEGASAGLLLHTGLALTVSGVPLGVVSQQMWVRAAASKAARSGKKQVAMAEKESQKWLVGLEQTLAASPPEVEVVTLGDRESDLYEFLLRAEQLGARYVIRAAQNRKLEPETACLWGRLAEQAVAGRMEIKVQATAAGPARTAGVTVRFAAVRIKAPQRLKALRLAGWQSVGVWAVWVREEGAPAGVEPLEWMLLTNVAVESLADGVERIAWYKVRFSIETYHKILKSGCRIEASRLMQAQRLKNYIALMMVVAWRLFWLTFINRESPEEVCTRVLTEAEWHALYCRTHRTTALPKEAPTVREAVRWIAKLGGFLGRAGDKEPGVTTIWRGWQRLTDIAQDWLIFHPS